jgi:hypothetical protein
VSGVRLSIYMGMWFVGALAYAAGVSTSSMTSPKPGETGTLSLKNSQYVSSGQTYFRDAASGENASVELGVDGQARWRKLTGRLRAKDEYSATERWNYLDIYELSAAYPLGASASLIAGRHLETWNAWEADWHQGVFQPRYMQNKARPEFAGLTGFFLTNKEKSTAFTLAFFAGLDSRIRRSFLCSRS